MTIPIDPVSVGASTARSGCDVVRLRRHYDATIADAAEAYLFGRQAQAETAYQRAFDLSIALLDNAVVTDASLQRVVDCCHHCIDFCRLPDDGDERYVLAIAAQRLAGIVDRHRSDKIRALALMAQAEVAELAHALARFNHSPRALAIVHDFNRAWADHAERLGPLCGPKNNAR